MSFDRKLHAESLQTLELWTHFVPSTQHSNQYDPNALTQLIELLDRTQQEWRFAVEENSRLHDMNLKQKQQIENNEKALNDSKENTRRIESELADANSQLESLRAELYEHQLIYQAAHDETMNANVTIRRSRQCDSISYTDDDGTNSVRRRKEAYYQSRLKQRVKRRSNSLQIPSGKRAKHTVNCLLEKEENMQQKAKTTGPIDNDTTTTTRDSEDELSVYRPPPILFTPISRLPIRKPLIMQKAPPISDSHRRSVSEPRVCMDNKTANVHVASPTSRQFEVATPLCRSKKMRDGITAIGAGIGLEPAGSFAADKFILGPVSWTSTTPLDVEAQGSRLISRMKRDEPLLGPFW